MHISPTQGDWIAAIREALQGNGFCIVTDIIPPAELALAHAKIYSAREQILNEVGEDKLRAVGEYGVLRAMMKFEPFFLTLLENPVILAIVDGLLGNKAILHLQNGFILPSHLAEKTPANFQNHFHRDFPRYLNGYLASVNVLCAIDAFTADNGATRLVPGSQQKAAAPDAAAMEAQAIAATCPAGGAIVFDSTLWHASGINSSGQDRLAINHQFTPAFFKPQMDYVRVLGESAVAKLPERSQQLLGYYSRPPASLDEYYRPEASRVYRKGQG